MKTAGAQRAAVRPRVGRKMVCKASADVARVAVLGASGYTGAEVVRLSALHPNITIAALTGEKQAGKSFAEVFPHLVSASNIGALVKIADVDFDQVDAVFCCLPHATTQQIIKSLPTNLKIVDLSADFRLRDVNTYAQWYGGEHAAPELQEEAVYGLTELKREEVKKARLVANPGCYPTTVQIPLVPLLEKGLISKDDIIIDAKSGVSGAGRAAKESNLYTEIAEGINAYGVSSHRHMPEIEQGLSDAAGADVRVSFTPHLMGMQSTIYVKLENGATPDSLRAELEARYAGEPFVRILPKGVVPHTRHVRGSNFCFINVFPDRIAGRAIVICVIDNLVKGASGQALQNLNLVMGFPETTGLLQLAMFP
ncbi:N-acetyl-gamma-glutamyl-phosphatereductase [Monoraphidium neglectum]|uniref:Probable N-acetyl-gamma-glutamyl-phosphate reductase, chloroplastic n=1 Tax=Monoraphidium neglectum TaxID=145388 RepID=A0A0D2N9E6_9CHLO|nr:N-acetyl-gamma-glutamyl-phosphatereductase [Monoraphidium neglectum]KIZ02291.1 N-acetyl-gamma-glutamyl-phosphatereductase [Monoraphidium neglectum]|eukprot:XP_013901310.1 N-acetyl-gamma-glutamyl-phosphatereductase [Monoraphidium neglectum]